MTEQKESKVYAQIGVRINDELLKRLNDFAAAEQRSMSQVVRMALEQYMSK
jgi:predicted transcriptional regulator